MKAWSSWFGTSELALRLPSAALGVLAIGLIFYVGRELFSTEAGAVASLFLALNRMHVEFSREARFYPLFVCLVLANALFFMRIIRKPTKSDCACYATTLALAIYAHLYAAFFLAAEILWIVRLTYKRERVRTVILWMALGVGLIAPFLFLISGNFSARVHEQLYWLTRTRLNVPATFYYRAFGSAMFPLSLLLMGFALSRRSEETWWLLCWSLTPVFAVYLASLMVRPLFAHRYLLSVLPALLILSAQGLTILRRSSRTAWAIILVYLLVVCGWHFNRSLGRRALDWSTIDQTSVLLHSPDVLLVPEARFLQARYYLGEGRPVRPVSCADEGVDINLSSFWYLYIGSDSCTKNIVTRLLEKYELTARINSKDAVFSHFSSSKSSPPSSG